MRDPVEFELGGAMRSVVVTLGLAPKIETATGRPLMPMADEMLRFAARTMDSANVVRAALAHAGETLTADEVLTLAEREGLVALHKAAARIVNALFLPADKQSAPAKKRGTEKTAADPTR